MARLTASKAIDMFNGLKFFVVQPDDVISASTTKLIIRDNNRNKQEYGGFLDTQGIILWIGAIQS